MDGWIRSLVVNFLAHGVEYQTLILGRLILFCTEDFHADVDLPHVRFTVPRITHSCRRRQLLFWLKLFCTQRLAILLPRDAMRLLDVHLYLYNVYLPVFTVIT